MDTHSAASFWELVAIVVGIVALILAVWHLYEIRAQARDIDDQKKVTGKHTEQLELILQTQSTHHLDQFPLYMSKITSLIENAEKEIVILCDFPAYGSFTAPEDFLKYRQAIERKISEGLDVRLTCLNSPRRVALTHEQFSREEKQWSKWKKATETPKRLEKFLKRHHSDASIETLTVDQFAGFLEMEDKRMLEEYFAQAKEVSEIDEFLSIYFWLIDGKSAVFAIPSYSEKSTEHGFSTIDSRLISGLEDLRARYLRGEFHM